MIALYRPGTSLVHRSPAWLKLLTLAGLVLGISFTGTWWPGIAAAWGIVVLGYLLAGLGVRELLRQVLLIRWLVLVMAVTQLVFLTVPDALANTLRVVSVIVLAALLTLTTRMGDLLDTLQAGLEPLQRVGVQTAQIGLTIALAVTSIPVIAGLAGQLRDAQLARTGKLRPAAFVVPLLVLSLKHADELADALRARGVA